MSSNVAKIATSRALGLVGRLDADLAEAIKSEWNVPLGDNIVEPDGNGGDVVIYTQADPVETWRLPPLINADVKARAAAAYRQLMAEMDPPSLEDVKIWLGKLGAQTGHANMPKDPDKRDVYVQTIIATYAETLYEAARPRACFTPQTLGLALRQFPTWFPKGGELLEFTEQVLAPMRQTLERLREIAKADERDLRGTFDYHTPEERKAYWEAHADKRREEINARYGINKSALNGMSRDEAIKAAYAAIQQNQKIKTKRAKPGTFTNADDYQSALKTLEANGHEAQMEKEESCADD